MATLLAQRWSRPPPTVAPTRLEAATRRPISRWWLGLSLLILLGPAIRLALRFASYLLLWLPLPGTQRPHRRMRRVRYVRVATARGLHRARGREPRMPRPSHRHWRAHVGVAPAALALPAVAVNARTFARDYR